MSELLTPEDDVFINEITKRCCSAPWGTVHAEVQYTALHFQIKGRAELLKHRSRPELREKIAKRLQDKYHPHIVYSTSVWQECLDQADQLLLLYPDEEAIAEKCTAAFYTGLSMGKREEKERITELMNPYIKQVVDCERYKDGDAVVDPVGLTILDYYWEALKKGE